MKKARRLRIITAGPILTSKCEKCEMGGSTKYNILSVNIKVQFTFNHLYRISYHKIIKMLFNLLFLGFLKSLILISQIIIIIIIDFIFQSDRISIANIVHLHLVLLSNVHCLSPLRNVEGL